MAPVVPSVGGVPGGAGGAASVDAEADVVDTEAVAPLELAEEGRDLVLGKLLHDTAGPADEMVVVAWVPDRVLQSVPHWR